MIKIFSILTYTLLLSITVFAEQAPDNKSKYQIIDDSVHYTDGRVISFEQFSKENPEIIDNKKEKANKNENIPVENGRIISSWKFYTIMLAFPIFLILLFILVFIRGRKKDK